MQREVSDRVQVQTRVLVKCRARELAQDMASPEREVEVISQLKSRKCALLYSGVKPFRDVPINSKEKPTKENLEKVKPSKEKPGKRKPDVDPDAMDTGSNGKSDEPVVVHTGGKPKEYKADSNSNAVDDEVAKALDSLEKK